MQAHKVQGEVGADMEVHVKESSRKLSLAWQCVQIKQDFYSMPWSKPFLSESGQIEVFKDMQCWGLDRSAKSKILSKYRRYSRGEAIL